MTINPHNKLQTAVFAAHMYEDELERQKERYVDAFLRVQAGNPREALTTLEAWRVQLFEGGKEPSLFDAIKADPIWSLAVIPDDVLREEAERV